MKCLIADDHPFMRKGLRESLEMDFHFSEILEASNGLDAFNLLLGQEIGLAIVDISMPGKGGLELIKDVLAVRSQVKFLVLSVYPEREFAERAYLAGAKGYLGKMRPPQEFAAAVRYILRGRIYVSEEYSETLIRRLKKPKRNDLSTLSDREFTILNLFSAGESLTEIGKQLNISVKTVSTHKTRLMEKLDIGNNAELIAFALEQGLGKTL